MTIAAAVTDGVARLVAAGWSRDEAATDAAVIARGLLGWSLADWLSRRDADAPADVVEAFNTLIARRAAHEPVAYLLGAREFYGRNFRVRPGVLIPRPETELLVEVALQWMEAIGARTIVDVGTGSGCIAVTLALEAHDEGTGGLSITATDQSSAALDIARANAEALGVPPPIDWRQTDLLDGITGPLDLVVSNPPYVRDGDRATLAPDVRDYEPAAALFGGDDGLDVVRRLIPAAAARLRPGGALIMEVGHDQRPAVTTLLDQAGFQRITWHTDLQGIPRVVAAVR